MSTEKEQSSMNKTNDIEEGEISDEEGLASPDSSKVSTNNQTR